MPDSAHDAPADILELMPRCRGCRHWLMPPPGDPRGFCLLISDRPAESKARVFGPLQSEAALFTEPDFGCIQFRSREED